MKRLLLSIILIVLTAQINWAFIPRIISYQGVLTDASGTAVPNGGYSLTFSLYDTPASGAALWTETLSPVPVANGIFSVILGNSAPLALPFDQQYWLGVSIDAGPELTPRTKLTASAYSLNALSVVNGAITSEKLATEAVTTTKIANGSVTDGKIAAEAVVTAKIADDAIISSKIKNAAVTSDKIGNGQVVKSINGLKDDVTLDGGPNVDVSESGSTITISVTGGTGDAWNLTGNAGTNPVGNFLGTTDNIALVLRVNNARAMIIEPHDTSPNIIAGFDGNRAIENVFGAAVAGGGESSLGNWVTDNYGAIGGGANNRAGDNEGTTDDMPYATVGGGFSNKAQGSYSTVCGGFGNDADAEYGTVAGGGRSDPADSLTGNRVTDSYGTIGGGADNQVGDADGNHSDEIYATVCGGKSNKASARSSTVGGGEDNTAEGPHATVSGGEGNEATDYHTTVGGGEENTASGEHATVAGGHLNSATDNYSTVGGGYTNGASGEFSTIGGGYNSSNSGYCGTIAGGFINNASGWSSTVGGGYDNAASGYKATVPGGSENVAEGGYSFAAGRKAIAKHEGTFVWGDSTESKIESTGEKQFIVRASGGIWFGTTSSPSIPTGRFINTSTGAHLTTGGAWTNGSDRARKENFVPVDRRDILIRLASVPISTWSYKAEDPSTRHVGPVAQDFYAAFGLGQDEKHICTVDADGVALAAIQGIYELVKERDAKIAELEGNNSDLEERVKALEKLVSSLAQKQSK